MINHLGETSGPKHVPPHHHELHEYFCELYLCTALRGLKCWLISTMPFKKKIIYKKNGENAVT